MTQKASAVGNWWLAASSQQWAPSCIMSYVEIFGETSNHPGDSAPLKPRFGALWLLTFPKTKVTFEREEISAIWGDSGKYDRAADGNWENCVRAQGAYFAGDWVSLSCVQCCLYLVSSSINVSFSYYMAGYLLETLCVYVYTHTHIWHANIFWRIFATMWRIADCSFPFLWFLCMVLVSV